MSTPTGNKVQIQEHSNESKQRLKKNAGEKADANSTPRLVKLISIKLKEAALDSPSFRASVNYFNTQIDQTEHWIEGLLKSLRKYPQQYHDFKEVNKVLFNQLVPDFLKDGLINQDNSAFILDTSKTNLSSLWDGNMNLLGVNETEIVELLTDLQKNHLKYYKEIRKNFEFFQNKFDTLLSKYLSQSKTKEPSALREDAFQLYEVRKTYLNTSLDICLHISKLNQELDRCLVQLSELLFKNKDALEEKYFEKVRAWSTAVTESVKSLLEDMTYSRNQIEESTAAQFLPSRDLVQHNPLLINPTTLTDPDPDAPDDKVYEKHGWLFMKTTVGKPARQIWVRRWVFVKSGIFGLFSLAPSKNFVQETDKIGVLLSNIRFAPDEERRFCFEIKTIDVTVVFQADSLRELKSWLRVFSLEKQRAIENSETEEYAFGRYPPLLYEFASTSLTSVDIELTSSKADNTRNDDTHTTVTSSHLSQLVGGNENLDFKYSTSAGEFQEPEINLPITTKMSKCAILAHAFLDSTVIPTAVTANIWGSVNWGIYYITNPDQNPNDKINGNEKDNNLSALSKADRYPPNYPPHLKTFDVQLKALFDTGIPKDELVVLHFSCLWSLNPKQELSGRCFITTKYCYFYLNSTGFVALLKKPLIDLVAVDVTIEKDWDTLKVYDIEGLNMKGRIFLEDGRLIQKKIDVLINNSARDAPKPQSEIIQVLESLEGEETKNVERKQSLKRKDTFTTPPIDSELQSFQPFSGIVLHNKSMKTNYYSEYDQCSVKTFDAPAKAIFHILFGDNSSILKHTIQLIDKDEFIISPWSTGSKDDELKRSISFKMNLSSRVFSSNSKSNVRTGIVQTIEDIVDAKYYRIREERDPFRIPSGDVLRLLKRYVIIEVDAKTSKLFIYSKADTMQSSFTLGLWANIVKKSAKSYQKAEGLTINQELEDNVQRLGSHGKVIKAIRIFGNLSKAEGKFSTLERPFFDFTLNLMIKFYTKKILAAFAATVFSFTKALALGIYHLAGSLSMNKVLLVFLGLSALLNVFLTGRATVSFWTAKRAEHLIKDFAYDLSINKMERAIYLNELDVLSSFNFNSSSECFDKFMHDKITDVSGSEVDTRFRESRHQLAVKRNEMLVELKILEKVEKELVAGSWKNFLLSEIHLCKISLDDMNISDPSLGEYCSSCIEEFEKISTDDLINN